MVLAVLLSAGLHVPETPLVEVVGSGVITAPKQTTDGEILKVGVTVGLMVTVTGSMSEQEPTVLLM